MSVSTLPGRQRPIEDQAGVGDKLLQAKQARTIGAREPPNPPAPPVRGPSAVLVSPV